MKRITVVIVIGALLAMSGLARSQSPDPDIKAIMDAKMREQELQMSMADTSLEAQWQAGESAREASYELARAGQVTADWENEKHENRENLLQFLFVASIAAFVFAVVIKIAFPNKEAWQKLSDAMRRTRPVSSKKGRRYLAFRKDRN